MADYALSVETLTSNASVLQRSGSAYDNTDVDAAALAEVQAMGFGESLARAALRKANGSIEAGM